LAPGVGAHALVGDGGEPAGGIGQAGPEAPYTGIVVHFPVDDVDSSLARTESLGCARVLDPGGHAREPHRRVHRPRRQWRRICSIANRNDNTRTPRGGRFAGMTAPAPVGAVTEIARFYALRNSTVASRTAIEGPVGLLPSHSSKAPTDARE